MLIHTQNLVIRNTALFYFTKYLFDSQSKMLFTFKINLIEIKMSLMKSDLVSFTFCPPIFLAALICHPDSTTLMCPPLFSLLHQFVSSLPAVSHLSSVFCILMQHSTQLAREMFQLQMAP